MTNLEKLIEVFGCTITDSIGSLSITNLDNETCFTKEWCNEEYKAPSDKIDDIKKLMNSIYGFNVIDEIDTIRHDIDSICKFMERHDDAIDKKIEAVERKIDKCWNRIGKGEQKLTELDSHLSKRIDRIERTLNNLTPPLKEQSEEDFLKALRDIKVVRIK